MTTVEVLRGARARIVECGWAQAGDDGAVPVPSVCVLIALNDISTVSSQAFAAGRVLADVVGAAMVCDLTVWNDEPGRTQAEVLAAFDKAIALAESES